MEVHRLAAEWRIEPLERAEAEHLEADLCQESIVQQEAKLGQEA